MRDCIVKELRCPRTGRVFMWDLIEVKEAPVATAVEAVEAVAVAVEVKKLSVPTSMELKVWGIIGNLLAKESLTLEEVASLRENKSLMRMFALERMHCNR